MQVQLSPYMPRDATLRLMLGEQTVPSVIYCGARAYRAIQWEVEGRKAWFGRDRRRLKRERRKFMASAS